MSIWSTKGKNAVKGKKDTFFQGTNIIEVAKQSKFGKVRPMRQTRTGQKSHRELVFTQVVHDLRSVVLVQPLQEPLGNPAARHVDESHVSSPSEEASVLDSCSSPHIR